MKKYIDKLKQQSSYLEKGVNINDVVPAAATHPGEILANELTARKLTQSKFAEMCGVQPSQLNEIIKGKRGINVDNALVFEHQLKIDAEFWLRVQMHFELDVARIKVKKLAFLKRNALKVKHIVLQKTKPALKKSTKKLAKV
ncbi:MAG: hypothetical protein RL064_776 [Bacteroidota bacterium]|jgi:addiction module HigA family antidote